MRIDGGYEVIKKAIDNLRLRHDEYIAANGEGSESPLTRKHETANMKTFKWGVVDRRASIMVGMEIERDDDQFSSVQWKLPAQVASTLVYFFGRNSEVKYQIIFSYDPHPHLWTNS
ncbi:unnamed protein product [Fraxinus pennsylvanica]|uniref:Glutamate--ammonia ligase n=1 Tax=Fraxinus pennsylvanica TaxID=56036 RepID=A0AAD2EEY6_9LAMI|nr:unnamed protein product [Fraxinus pennsylvanica]